MWEIIKGNFPALSPSPTSPCVLRFRICLPAKTERTERSSVLSSSASPFTYSIGFDRRQTRETTTTTTAAAKQRIFAPREFFFFRKRFTDSIESHHHPPLLSSPLVALATAIIFESLRSPFERPHPKDRGMKKRGVVGRINSKHERVSAFSTVGHGTGLPGAYVHPRICSFFSPSLPLSLSSRTSLVLVHATNFNDTKDELEKVGRRCWRGIPDR